MKLWIKVSGSFYFFPLTECYTVRILYIMKTFSILDDYTFFFFFCKRTRNLNIRHPSLSICGTSAVTVAPPFPQGLQTSLSKWDLSSAPADHSVSCLWVWGHITPLPRSPRHTLSHIFFRFPHVSGSEIFFFFWFFCPSIASIFKSFD